MGFFEIDSLEGRNIYALYVLGSTLYAATDSGVWKHEVSFTLGVAEEENFAIVIPPYLLPNPCRKFPDDRQKTS
jgi:hypothetical protein